MDARKERGLQLAQRGHIVKHADGWQVPPNPATALLCSSRQNALLYLPRL